MVAKTQWNSGINSTGILDSDWLTALTHVIIRLIFLKKGRGAKLEGLFS